LVFTIIPAVVGFWRDLILAISQSLVSKTLPAQHEWNYKMLPSNIERIKSRLAFFALAKKSNRGEPFLLCKYLGCFAPARAEADVFFSII